VAISFGRLPRRQNENLNRFAIQKRSSCETFPASLPKLTFAEFCSYNSVQRVGLGVGMSRTSSLLIGVFLFVWACVTSPTPLPPVVSVTLTPHSATIHCNKALQFTASVLNATNTSVTWSLAGEGCSGPTCGTISSTGLYTPPGSAPWPPTVTVKATSVADASKSASATITLLDSVMVTIFQQDVLVTAGEDYWFGAKVENAIDSSVTWTLLGSSGTGVEYGTISKDGEYAAPSVIPDVPTITITATSVEDPTASGSTTVTIRSAGIIDTAWTWVSGSDMAGQRGVYGTKGIPDPSNVPGARAFAASWLDPSGNLWLFGGSGPDVGNDLWKYDPLSQAWTWESGSNVGNLAGVYGTKGKADPSNIPGARSNPLSWSDASGRFWLFGGMGFDSEGVSHYLGDLWLFDPTTSEWAWMSGSDTYQFGSYGTKGIADPSNMPGGRYRGASWIDASGKLWLFGGWGYTSIGGAYMLNDLWTYDPVTSEWTWVSGTDQFEDAGEYGMKGVPSTLNFPGARCDAITWIDARGKLWLFGGYDYYSGMELNFNDLWKFDPMTLEWTWVSGSDWPNQLGYYGTKGIPDPRNVPGGRSKAASWIDSSGNLWLFGGSGYLSVGYSDTLNDLWRFDPTTLEWTWVSGSDYVGFQKDWKGIYGTKNVPDLSNIPGPRTFALSWYDASGRFWLFGGSGFDSASNAGALNDLWYFMRLAPVPTAEPVPFLTRRPRMQPFPGSSLSTILSTSSGRPLINR
jgi:N-acetylneuraminic acid mutarotase